MAILQKTGITGSLSISSSGIRPTTSASLFNVNGYNGRLLSVVDTLSGSLFSVNSIAGLPIFEVFSNNRVVAGKYAANDFVISGSRVGIGTSSPTGMFEIYKSTPGGLGGTLILNNDGTIVANETAIIFGDGNVNNRRAAISSTTEGSPFYGDIKFKTGLSAYGSLNTRMIILGNGNVGIGTTSPAYTLDVSPNTSTVRLGRLLTGAWPAGNTYAFFGNTSLDHTGGGNYALLQYTDGTTFLNAATGTAIYFRIANATKMMLDSNGNLGIGTTSPSNVLDAAVSVASSNFLGNAAIYPLAIKNYDTTAGNAVGMTFGQGGYGYTNFIASVRTGTGANPKGDLVLGGRPSDGTTFAEVMRLQAGGNVGIGTTSPSALLNIRASAPTSTGTVTTGTNLLIDSNTSNYITFRNTGDNATYAGLTFLDNNTGGYVVFRNYASNDVIAGSDCMIYGTYQDHIFQNGTSETINGKIETLRIKQNGSVGIGANSPSAKLHISSSTTTALRIETKTSSGADSEIEFVGPDTHSYAMGIDESDSDKFKISYAASRTPPNLGTNDRFVIQTDGKIGIGTSVAETDLSIIDMNLGRVGIGTVTYYGVWLTGGTSATDYSFLSSPSDTNLYLNAPSTKGIYNQINNVNRFIITTDFVRINNSAAGADGEEFQRWSYISTDNYYLKLIQTVTAGVVRYNFCMVNNATAYNNVLVLDRGNVGIGTVGAGSPAALAAKLDVLGTVKISDDTGIGAVNDGTSRLYVQGEGLTEPFLSVQTCLGNNSNSTATYNTLKGYLAVKIGNNVGSGTALITAGTYYLRLWGGV